MPHPTGDVVFVHGLDGDAFETWQLKDDPNSYWPVWLAQDCPDLAVWSLGYSAESSRWKNETMGLPDRAGNVLMALQAHEIGTRPLAFITHSLGGLVVKQLLRTAKEIGSSEWKPIADHTKGVVFLATPHTGASVANIARCIPLYRPNPIISDLANNDARLRELNSWYREHSVQLGIRTQAYFETRVTAGLMLVVDQSSSDPGVQGVVAVGMDADHASICKPESRETSLYLNIRRFVRQLFKPPHAPQVEAVSTPTPTRTKLGSRVDRIERIAERVKQAIRTRSDVFDRLGELTRDAVPMLEDFRAAIVARASDPEVARPLFRLFQASREVEEAVRGLTGSPTDGPALSGYLIELQHNLIAPLSELVRALEAATDVQGEEGPLGDPSKDRLDEPPYVRRLGEALAGTDSLSRYETVVAIGGEQRDEFLREAKAALSSDVERIFDELWRAADLLVLTGKRNVKPILDFAADTLPNLERRAQWGFVRDLLFSDKSIPVPSIRPLLENSHASDRAVVGRCMLLHKRDDYRAEAMAVLQPPDFWYVITYERTPIAWLVDIWRHLRPRVEPSYLKVFLASVRDALSRPMENEARARAAIALLGEFYQFDGFHEGFYFRILLELETTIRFEAERHRIPLNTDQVYLAHLNQFFSQGPRLDQPVEVSGVPLPIQRKLARRGHFTKLFARHPRDPIALECAPHILGSDNIAEYLALTDINGRLMAQVLAAPELKERGVLQRREVSYVIAGNPKTPNHVARSFAQRLGADQLRRLAVSHNANQAGRDMAMMLLKTRALPGIQRAW